MERKPECCYFLTKQFDEAAHCRPKGIFLVETETAMYQ